MRGRSSLLVLSAIGVLGVITASIGCNTTSGIGKDIQEMSARTKSFIEGNEKAYPQSRGLFGDRSLEEIEYHLVWEPSGHKYTTYIIARIAGYSVERSHKFSYFSQMPDLVGDLKAIDGVSGFFLALSSEKLKIKNLLHSLHGGDPSEVISRRSVLAKMISELRKADLEGWKVGLLIHAYGDAFSHITPRGGAYGAGVGHGLAGHMPDKIYRNWEKYETFTRSLYRILSGDNSDENQADLEQFFSKAKGGIFFEGITEEVVMQEHAEDLGFNEEFFNDAKGVITSEHVFLYMNEMERRFKEFEYDF